LASCASTSIPSVGAITAPPPALSATMQTLYTRTTLLYINNTLTAALSLSLCVPSRRGALVFEL
jgi:hypothetical protein